MMDENITINSPEIEAQIGESDTLLDQIKTMIRQNKLAAFSAVVIGLIILAAVFAPLPPIIPMPRRWGTGFRRPGEPIFWEPMNLAGTCSAELYTARGFLFLWVWCPQSYPWL